MRERSPGAGVARRHLGTSLRRLRERANVRLEAVARELECSPAKISRLENGKGPAKLFDVRVLLTLYGVTDPAVRRRHEDWARETKSEGWWERDADLTSGDVGRYIATETVAAWVRIYVTPALPALLQSAAYAEAHSRILHPGWTSSDLSRFESLRQQRQGVMLRRDESLHFEAVLDEAALLRRVGTPQVHADALDWLADTVERLGVKDRNGLRVRVVPLAAGPGRAVGSFTIFEPCDAELDPVTAFVEGHPEGGTWLENGMAQTMIDIFEERLAAAVGEVESIQMLRDTAAMARQRPASLYQNPINGR